MSKSRLLVLLPLLLVLATLSSRPDADVRRQQGTAEPGPSLALAQTLGVESQDRSIDSIADVVRGTARPPAVRLRLADRPELSRGSGKPNIVWVLTDDMALSDLQSMPAVQRLLGERGTTFANALSTDSLCCPARATLITGRSAHNHRTVGNDFSSNGGWPVFERFNDTANLLPVWLQKAGYRTWMMGKYLNGYNGNDRQPGWDFFYAPTRGIFDPHAWTARVNDRWVKFRRSYQQRVVTAYAVQDMATFARRGEPFFMFVQSIAPHGMWPDDGWVPPIPEKRYQGTVAPATMPVQPNTEEWDVSDKSTWLREQPFSTVNHTYTWARRLESLMSVDASVAALVRQAKRSGVYDNTLFVFTSDNGFSYDAHRYWGKNVPYEESARIPLVIAGPGFGEGVVARQQATLEDVVATTVRAAGATAPWPLDGVPLQGFDDQPRLHRDRAVLIEGSVSGLPKSEELPVDSIGRFYTAVRWRQWKLIRYATGESELYDLRRDPYELVNVYDGVRAAPSRRGEILRVQGMLGRWLDTHQFCVGGRACTRPPG